MKKILKMINYEPKLIVFDAYGTLVHITKKATINPYKMISQNIGGHGYNPVTMDISLEQFNSLLKNYMNYKDNYEEAVKVLKIEVGSIEPYPEALDVIKTLKSEGFKIAVCSNLANEYAKPIINIFGDLIDEYVWSFEHYAKPDVRMYATVEGIFELYGKEIHMIGDSYINDYQTPRELMGWASTFLKRTDEVISPISRFSGLETIYADLNLKDNYVN